MEQPRPFDVGGAGSGVCLSVKRELQLRRFARFTTIVANRWKVERTTAARTSERSSARDFSHWLREQRWGDGVPATVRLFAQAYLPAELPAGPQSLDGPPRDKAGPF